MKKYLLSIVALALILSGCIAKTDEDKVLVENINVQQVVSSELNATENQTYNTSYPISKNSLDPKSIQYLGAFLLPTDGEPEQNMFSYGGEALCYNPQSNTLFITGHNWFTYIAEINIPEPIVSSEISQLHQAEIITPFTDIKGDLFSGWSMEIPRVGLEVIDNNLLFCFGQHFEEDNSHATHGYTSTKLSNASKVCQVGDYLYATNDYMFKIPSKYISSFNGYDLLTGRYRDGGWSGMGPGLFAVSSNDIIESQDNEKIKTSPLINYDTSYEGDTGSKMNDYSHADSITGGAFLSCEAGNSIAFIATHSFGESWYGFSNGVVYPTDGDEDAIYPDVPGYPHDQRGWWSDDFRAALILYDPMQLSMVLNGEIAPSSVQPYAIIDLNKYMIGEKDETDMQYLGSCAYDIESNRLFVLELFADEAKPIVHVFTFE